MPGSGWDSTGGVPGPVAERDVSGAVLVEWMPPGGHGSADPGLGMNRPPDRLYPAVLVVLGSCRLWARGERRRVFPFRTWRSSAGKRSAR